MRRYKFRLERLLELRRYKERQWEMRLAEAAGKCARLENHIRDLRDESFEYAGFSEGGGLCSAADIVAREFFRKRLELEIGETETRLTEARAEREKVQAAYLEASRERKVLDKLKEHKAEEYYDEQKRTEAKIMNETAMFQRVGREGGE